MRDAFVKVLTEEAAHNSDIMLMVGDLGFGVVAAFEGTGRAADAAGRAGAGVVLAVVIRPRSPRAPFIASQPGSSAMRSSGPVRAEVRGQEMFPIIRSRILANCVQILPRHREPAMNEGGNRVTITAKSQALAARAMLIRQSDPNAAIPLPEC